MPELTSIAGFPNLTSNNTTTPIVDYDEALRIDPNNAEAYLGRGLARLDLEQYNDAIVDYDAALRINLYDAGAYFGRGLAKFHLQRYDDAINDYNQAITLDRTTEAYYGRGLAKFNLKRYDDAIFDYDEALRIDPKHVGAYLSRGHAKFNLKRYNDAIADYDEVLRIDSANQDARRYRDLASDIITKRKDQYEGPWEKYKKEKIPGRAPYNKRGEEYKWKHTMFSSFAYVLIVLTTVVYGFFVFSVFGSDSWDLWPNDFKESPYNAIPLILAFTPVWSLMILLALLLLREAIRYHALSEKIFTTEEQINILTDTGVYDEEIRDRLIQHLAAAQHEGQSRANIILNTMPPSPPPIHPKRVLDSIINLEN